MTSRTTATDDCMALIKDTLDAITMPVHWPNLAFEQPSGATMWARVTMQHYEEGVRSLGKHGGMHHYQSTGRLVVEVRYPLGISLPEETDPAMMLRAAFRSGPTDNGVTLRNAMAQEKGVDGAWNRVDVSVEFEYDEVS